MGVPLSPPPYADRVFSASPKRARGAVTTLKSRLSRDHGLRPWLVSATDRPASLEWRLHDFAGAGFVEIVPQRVIAEHQARGSGRCARSKSLAVGGRRHAVALLEGLREMKRA